MHLKRCMSEQDAFWEAQRKKRSYVMLVTYDGTDFQGFQRQGRAKDQRTVAGALEKALSTMLQVEASTLSIGVRGPLLQCEPAHAIM
jgi:hypothetical protein